MSEARPASGVPSDDDAVTSTASKHSEIVGTLDCPACGEPIVHNPALFADDARNRELLTRTRFVVLFVAATAGLIAVGTLVSTLIHLVSFVLGIIAMLERDARFPLKSLVELIEYAVWAFGFAAVSLAMLRYARAMRETAESQMPDAGQAFIAQKAVWNTIAVVVLLLLGVTMVVWPAYWTFVGL
jgi:Ca2+/Na+ antiporter